MRADNRKDRTGGDGRARIFLSVFLVWLMVATAFAGLGAGRTSVPGREGPVPSLISGVQDTRAPASLFSVPAMGQVSVSPSTSGTGNQQLLAAQRSLEAGQGPGAPPYSSAPTKTENPPPGALVTTPQPSAPSMGHDTPSQSAPAVPSSASTPTWFPVKPSSQPEGRSDASMAYDAKLGYVVLFGGDYAADTWKFVGGQWTQLFPTTSPPERSGASMVYDPVEGYLLLFGGSPDGYVDSLGDTWTFAGGQWTQLSLSTSPSPRAAAAMAWDPLFQWVVLFGGDDVQNGGDHLLGDTWEFYQGQWEQRPLGSSTSPSPRIWAAMAGDTADGYVLLFGGRDHNGNPLGDTWELSGSTWTQLSPSSSPSARESAQMAYDDADSYVLLFGGKTNSNYHGDTWEFLGGQWTQLSLSASPPASSRGSLAFDSADSSMILFGGDNLASAWAYSVPVTAPDPPTTTPTNGVAEAGVPVTFSITGITGAGGYGYTWNGLPPGCAGSGTSFSCTPSLASAGKYSVTVTVTASRGFPVTSPALALTIYPHLSNTLAASPSTIDLKQTSDLTDTASQGTPGSIQYSWSGLPSGTGCSATSATTSVSCTPSGTGTSTVKVTATDGMGGTAAAAVTLTVNPDPTVVVTSSVPAVDLGQTVTFTASPSGGSGGYSYVWSNLPTGCSTSNLANLSCKSTAAGTYDNVGVTVTDSLGTKTTGSIPQFTVDTALTALPPHLEFATQLQGPSARYGAAMAFDAADGYVVLFGGATLNATGGTVYLGDTWTFQGGQWHLVNTAGPSPRSNAAMAYDAGDGYVVLFGGKNSTLGLQDTWDFVGGHWTPLYPVAIPGGRSAASMAYDAVDRYVVLFGGISSGILGDTWEFHGGNWYLVSAGGSSSTPKARFYSMMAYDDAIGKVVLFGGDLGLSNTSDTWEFSGGAWTSLSPSTSPTSMLGASMVYDPATADIVLFGGAQVWMYGFLQSYLVYLNSTWKFTGTTWSQLSLPGNQTGLLEGSAAYDAYDNDIAYFGGQGGQTGYPSNETWYMPSTETGWFELFPSLDTGQTITFTVTPEGGSGGYHFSWSFPSGSGCLNADQGSISCSFLLTGDFPISVVVTDSNSDQTTTKLSFRVYAPPGNVQLSTTHSSRDVGQTFTLTASVSGGTGLYTYQWAGLPAGCSPPTLMQAVVNCTAASAGTGGNTVRVTVTDTNDYTPPTQPTLMETIWTDPMVTSVTANRTVTDVGVPDALVGLFSGGSGGYSYSWTTPSGCSQTNTPDPTCVFAYPVPVSMTFAVTDNNGFKANSAPLDVTVHSSPSYSLTVNGSTSKTVDLGQVAQFVTSLTGGTPPYTYSYAGLPAGCPTQNKSVLNCTSAATGTFTVTVTVNDSGGYHGSASAPVTLVVDPDITFVSLVPSKQLEYPPYWPLNETYVGAGVGPLLNWSGGTPQFRGCMWTTGSAVPLACDGWNTTRAFGGWYWYNTPGTFPTKMTVIDSTGFNFSRSWTTVVYPLPRAVNLSGPTVMDAGTTAVLNGSIVGGSYPYHIWFNDTTTSTALCQATILSAASSTICDFSPATAGTNAIEYTVAYALGAGYDGSWSSPIPGKETANLTIIVNPTLSGFKFLAKSGTYSAFQNGLLLSEVGATVTLNGSFAGGTAPYLCSYYLGITLLKNWITNSPSCPATTLSPIAAARGLVLNLTVSDNVSQGLVGSIWMDVNLALTLNALSASPSVPDAGVPCNLTVSESGGLPAYSYAWDFGDGNTQTTTQPWVSHSWKGNGSYTLSLTVTDGGGITRSISSQVRVLSDPNVPVMSASDGPIAKAGLVNGSVILLPNGTTVALNVSEAGGTGPYTYVWTLDGVVMSNTTVSAQWALLQVILDKDGDRAVRVTVTDSQGRSSVMDVTLKVVTDAILSLNLTGIPQTEVAGTTGNVTVTFLGGFAPFVYRWTVAFPNSTFHRNTTIPWLNVPWDELGTVTITLFVTDGFQTNGTVTKDVTVIDTLNSSASLTPARTVIDSGMWDNVSVVLNGGHSPYSYRWEVLFQGVTTGFNTSGPWLNRTWDGVSIVTVSMTATDEFGARASGVVTFTVNSVLAVPCAPTLSGVPMPGSPLTLSLSCLQGGTSPYTYLWDLGNSTSKTTSSQAVITFSQAAMFRIVVTVTDAAGATAVSRALSFGTIPPSITNVTYQVVTLGHSQTPNGTLWRAEITLSLQAMDSDGNVVTYRYSTSLSDLGVGAWVPAGERVLNLTLTSLVSPLYVEVMDNQNRTSAVYEVALNLTTTNGNHGTTNAQELSWGFYFMLIVIIVMVAFLVILALLQLRRKNKGPQSQTIIINGTATSDPVVKAIKDHLRENPNEEEGALIHHVAQVTAATEETVRTQLSILSSDNKVEKTTTGDTTRYSVNGAEVSIESAERNNEIDGRILAAVTKGSVSGAQLREALKPLDVSQAELITHLKYLKEDSSVTWDADVDFNDFDQVQFRAGPGHPVNTCKVEGSAVAEGAVLDPALTGVTRTPSPQGSTGEKESVVIDESVLASLPTPVEQPDRKARAPKKRKGN